MNIMEVLRMALSALSANVTRSLLTILAIVVGVFAVISASTAVSVIDNYFKETLTLFGGSVVQVSTRPTVQMGDNSAYRNREYITFDVFEQLQERSRLARSMNPEARFTWTRVEYEGVTTNPDVVIYGSNEHWISNNAYEIEAGRDLSTEDVINSRPVVLLGEDVRKKLFDSKQAVNERIRIDGQWYTVVGVVKPKGSAFGESLDKFVLAPYTRLGAVYGTYRNIDIQAQAPDMLMVNETIDEMIGNMRVIRDVAPGDPNDFEVSTNDSLQGTFDSVTGVLFAFGIIVGGVCLLGAGIGVMNIMLVSVTERTREIGIRKSIGATRKAIVQQFLLETIVICQIGGLIGIVVGVAGGNMLAVVMETSVVIPWAAVFTGVIGMTLIGLVFGVYPAVKASRLDPIVSLRYE